MSDREGSRSPINHKAINDREHSPHVRRDESPRNHKNKSYLRISSRSRKMSYREGDRDRERRGDRYRDRRSRSRSRSDRSYKSSRNYSRSHLRSPGFERRSLSHSPMSSRRRHTGTRDNPKPSRCLRVFGLSVYTTEDELYHIFCKYGPLERVQVVIDAKTGRSRGFSFVFFENTEDAKVAKDQCTGMKINGRNIRVDYSCSRSRSSSSDKYSSKRTGSSGMRSARDWVSLLSDLDVSALKNLQVAIKLHNISGRRRKSHTGMDHDLQRKLEKPEELVVHFRPDEVNRPLFDRDDIIVNEINCYEQRVIVQSKNERHSCSRSRSSSSDKYSSKRTRSKSTDRKRHEESPIRHRDKYRRRSRSRSSETRRATPSTSHSRNYSRSPPPKYVKHKQDSRKRSHSPQRTINFKQTCPSDTCRRRSCSPRRDHRHYRSRSPDYHRRYRSRSPSTKHPPRDYKSEMPPYYEGGEEYWYAGPPTLAPHFIPRQYLPPGGGFPRPILMPRLPPPMLLAPPMPFRPPLQRLPIYNQKMVKHRNLPSATVTTSGVTSTVTSGVTSAVTSGVTSTVTSGVTSTVTLPSLEVGEIGEKVQEKEQNKTSEGLVFTDTQQIE